MSRAVALVAILVLCFAGALQAQSPNASVTGRVTDASKADILDAKVRLINKGTTIRYEAKTNETGSYYIADVPVGTYSMEVEKIGFRMVIKPEVVLHVQDAVEINFEMAVGSVVESVTVESGTPPIQLTTSAIQSVVSSTTIRELPLNGRDWASLATLQPGVATVRTQETVGTNGSQIRGLGLQMTIDGNRPTQNSYRLNGVFINDYSNAGPGNVLGQNLGVDAIQEFSVMTSNYSAEYGFTSGGVINAITKSGTNDFHGSAYEFLRNSALDAANFFENFANLKKAEFRRNQFGGSAGGPIKKGKVFIFGDYEGLRQTKGIPVISQTPSSDARNGILHNQDGTTSTLTVDPTIQKFFTFYPLPNAGLIGPGNTGNYAFSGVQTVVDNYYTTRGDVKLSDKDNLSASWYHDRSTFTKPDPLNDVLFGYIVSGEAASLEESHAFSASMLNIVRGGFNRSTGNGEDTLAAINPAAADMSFGIFPGAFAPRIAGNIASPGVPGLTDFDGGLNGQSVQNYMGQNFQVYDDIVQNKGNHNLKFGGMFVRLQEDVFAPGQGDGKATFKSLANFLQNIPRKVEGPANPASITPHRNRDSIVGLYIQDDWKTRPGLTLNVGLRYEMATIPTETQHKIANMPTLFANPGVCTVTACPAFNKFYFASNPTLKNFEPRVGFAWDPFHNGRTAVRGGFGIFDVLPLPYELTINNAQTSPFSTNATVTNPGRGTFPHGIAPLLTTPADTLLDWNYVEPNPKRNYVYQWNFSVQRQVSANASVTLAYSGSRGIHNPFQSDDLNTVMPALTPAGYLFPNPVGSGVIDPNATAIVTGQLINANVGQIQSTTWQSKSWYNSLQARFDKRISHGIQLQVSFTWSKTMDTSSGSTAGDNFAGDLSAVLPAWDLRLDRGLADFNVGRNLVVNGLWRVPTPASFSGPAGWIFRGWQLGGLFTLSDGVPIFPLMGTDGDPLGQLNSAPLDFPNRLPGCSLTRPGDPSNYLNVNPLTGLPNCLIVPVAPSAAFYAANCDPTFGTFPQCFNLMGNLGRNTIIGPGLVNFDFSMVKDIPIRKFSEDFRMQFRAEFFNIFNRANFAPPAGSNLEAISSTGGAVPGFGQITSTQTPGREIQFGLKIVW